jgi:hypothetical protein
MVLLNKFAIAAVGVLSIAPGLWPAAVDGRVRGQDEKGEFSQNKAARRLNLNYLETRYFL